MIKFYEPEQYDFVKVKGTNSFGFIWEVYEDVATVVSVQLSETADTIIYGYRKYNIYDLNYVDPSEVNICGPLYEIRKELMDGNNQRCIYNYEEI